MKFIDTIKNHYSNGAKEIILPNQYIHTDYRHNVYFTKIIFPFHKYMCIMYVFIIYNAVIR